MHPNIYKQLNFYIPLWRTCMQIYISHHNHLEDYNWSSRVPLIFIFFIIYNITQIKVFLSRNNQVHCTAVSRTLWQDHQRRLDSRKKRTNKLPRVRNKKQEDY